MEVKRTLFDIVDQQLKNFVDNYFVFEFSSDLAESFAFKVPPMGFPTMLFCFGNKVDFFQHKHLSNESIIVGQLSKHVNLHPVSGTKIFGVNFKPYGFYNLFGISLKEIKDSAMESDTLLGSVKIAQIEESLDRAKSVEETIGLIEGVLLENRKPVQKNDFLDGVVDVIIQSNGLIDPFSLIEKRVSIRSFQRYFNEAIGINAKVFCQILRHKFILQLLYANPELKWNEMVLGGYYYDFSHFQKDFIKFSDVKPFEYLQFKNPFADKLV